jgi:multiple antibiotic resistance protein
MASQNVQDFFNFSLGEIFTFFFLMLGPLKLIGPFAKLTASTEDSDRRALAVRGTAIATLTVLVASFIGKAFLDKWTVSPGALAIGGGLLFLLVALPVVLSPYAQPALAAAPPATAPTLAQMQRQLVPEIVSPYGVATVILVLTLMPGSQLTVIGMLIAIMVLDLLAMLFARPILKVLGFPLQIVGTILGVLQVAFAVQMMIFGVKLVVSAIRHV